MTDLMFVADLGRCRLRVLHHRHLLADDRGLARRSHMRTQMVLDALEMARWSRHHLARTSVS